MIRLNEKIEEIIIRHGENLGHHGTERLLLFSLLLEAVQRPPAVAIRDDYDMPPPSELTGETPTVSELNRKLADAAEVARNAMESDLQNRNQIEAVTAALVPHGLQEPTSELDPRPWAERVQSVVDNLAAKANRPEDRRYDELLRAMADEGVAVVQSDVVAMPDGTIRAGGAQTFTLKLDEDSSVWTTLDAVRETVRATAGQAAEVERLKNQLTESQAWSAARDAQVARLETALAEAQKPATGWRFPKRGDRVRCTKLPDIGCAVPLPWLVVGGEYECIGSFGECAEARTPYDPFLEVLVPNTTDREYVSLPASCFEPVAAPELPGPDDDRHQNSE